MPLWLVLLVVLFFVVAAVALIISIQILDTHASQCLAQEALVAKDRVEKEVAVVPPRVDNHVCCICRTQEGDGLEPETNALCLNMGEESARSSSCSLQAFDCLSGLTSRRSGSASGLRGGWLKTGRNGRSSEELEVQPPVTATLAPTTEARQAQAQAALESLTAAASAPASSARTANSMLATITATISAPASSSTGSASRGADGGKDSGQAGGTASAPGATSGSTVQEVKTVQGASRRLVLEITMSSTPTVGQNGEPGQASKQVKLRIGAESLEGGQWSPSLSGTNSGVTSVAAQTLEQAIVEAAAGLNLPITTSVVSGPLGPPTGQRHAGGTAKQPGSGEASGSGKDSVGGLLGRAAAVQSSQAMNAAKGALEANSAEVPKGQASRMHLQTAIEQGKAVQARAVAGSSSKDSARVQATPLQAAADSCRLPETKAPPGKPASRAADTPSQDRKPAGLSQQQAELSRAARSSRTYIADSSNLALIEAKLAGGAIPEGDVRACQTLESLQLLSKLGLERPGSGSSNDGLGRATDRQGIAGSQVNILQVEESFVGLKEVERTASFGQHPDVLDEVHVAPATEEEKKKEAKKKKKSRNKKKKGSGTATVTPEVVQVTGDLPCVEADSSGPVDDVGCVCGAAKFRYKAHGDACPYPFTNNNSNIQRKIREQYEDLVRSNAAKTLTLAQVGKFTTCLVEAKQALQQKSESIQRRFTIAKSLLAKAEKSAFDRLCGQMYGLEIEQKKLEEDTLVYNRMQEQLKQSPAYQKMLEYGRTHFEVLPNTGQLIERVDSEEEELSFEELLEQEKKDPIWHQRLQSHSRASASVAG